jgi:hypothetical protein
MIAAYSSKDLKISVDGAAVTTHWSLLTAESAGIEPVYSMNYRRPVCFSIDVVMQEPRITAPARKRPRRVSRKIEARAGSLHHDPTRRRKPGSQVNAIARSLIRQQSARLARDLERLLLHGTP